MVVVISGDFSFRIILQRLALVSRLHYPLSYRFENTDSKIMYQAI